MVSGTLKETQANSEEWIKLDEKAFATLVLVEKPSQVRHIKNCKISEEVWKKLKSVYKPKGPVCRFTLYKTLLKFWQLYCVCCVFLQVLVYNLIIF